MSETPHQHINITPILQGVTGMGVSEPVGRDMGINPTPSSTVLDNLMQHRQFQPPAVSARQTLPRSSRCEKDSL